MGNEYAHFPFVKGINSRFSFSMYKAAILGHGKEHCHGYTLNYMYMYLVWQQISFPVQSPVQICDIYINTKLFTVDSTIFLHQQNWR